MEDKQLTVVYLQQALKADCQCVSAFNKLITNYLMGKEEHIKMIEAMTFTQESVWLKDYYLSKINIEVRPVSD